MIVPDVLQLLASSRRVHVRVTIMPVVVCAQFVPVVVRGSGSASSTNTLASRSLISRASQCSLSPPPVAGQ
jgi:hypothetical protein